MQLPPISATESVVDVHINMSLSPDQISQVKVTLEDYKEILTDMPGKTNLGVHTIKLTDSTPIRCKPYPIPHTLREEVERDVEKMIEMGVVTRAEPNSDFAFPLVALRKPDGSLRNCVDMRKLNQVTVIDSEPIPDQHEIFAQLAKDIYFTKIDLSKGYWQVPMDPESKKYVTFATNNGLYRFEVMAFGLVNSAATFSRIMRDMLKGLRGVHNYIDDILIHSTTWDMHMQTFTEVLRRLKSASLTARPSKCYVGYKEIEFLGHVIGQGQVKPKPDKVHDVKQAGRPKTKKQLRSFLGLVGYYRKFIPDFAAIACPLTNATKKGTPNKIVWGESEIRAFQTLKNKLMSAPILHLPNLESEFILRSDASEEGIGAVLLQEEDGELFPVAYASKKLNKAQRAYSVIEKECLALVWAIQKFETYLYGREFVIQTDHQPLACIKRKNIANGRILRWALALQPFKYRIEVIKGKDNIGADYMSRV